ncbi:MAG: carboxypeptidase-like regulatory domain-containing protein [Bacteroides sp.]|nr:carboxypeptidase-like regulatory domain-containing protein [Bacteroides sp.]
MKTELIKATAIFCVLCVCSPILSSKNRKSPDYVTVSGVVKDQQTRKTLEYVNISVPGTSIGTVTNSEGGFTIKVADSIQAKRLEISYLGYMNQIVTLKGEDLEDITVLLSSNANTLPEVVVRAMDPLKLVQEAASKVPVNNSVSPNLLTGFYRETVRKRRNYINVTEAVINIYKTPYSEDVDRDRVQVFKGRQLVSPKAGDTLIVKLQGGPIGAIYGDVVKNRDLILGEEALKDYKFKMETPVMLDERPHYVVSFEPQRIQPYPLFYGKLYIDEGNLSFTQAEFSYNMKDRNKITNAILKKKPFNLRFKPEELTYLVTYKNENGHTYLNYIRNEIKFKCDWKRRLFSTGYSVVSEMVVTDKQLQNVSSIAYRDAFKLKSVLSDNVGSFYDEDFWEGYNIIAPTESLESAVNKLKKQYR